MLAALVRDDPEQVEAVGMGRIGAEDLAVGSLSFRKLSGTVLVDRKREQPVGLCTGWRGHHVSVSS